MAESGDLSQGNLEVANNKFLFNGDKEGEHTCVVSSHFFPAHQIITLHGRWENESF